MRTKNIALLMVVALLGGALALPNSAAAQSSKTKVVGTDDEGDWGQDVDPTLAPVGDALGQDLVEAAIGLGDSETINFVITVSSLPPIGGTPEITRYSWNLAIDGDDIELDGKFTNYSRGVCDPTSGQCPPPRDPGMAPFFVRGNCAANEANVTLCEELGIVEAEFDASEGTITIPVPLELVGAGPRSLISPGANIFGGSISAGPSAYFTSSAMPLDTMVLTKNFRLPRKL